MVSVSWDQQHQCVPNRMLYMRYIWLIPNLTERGRTAPPAGKYSPLGMYSQRSAWCFRSIGARDDAFIKFMHVCF